MSSSQSSSSKKARKSHRSVGGPDEDDVNRPRARATKSARNNRNDDETKIPEDFKKEFQDSKKPVDHMLALAASRVDPSSSISSNTTDAARQEPDLRRNGPQPGAIAVSGATGTRQHRHNTENDGVSTLAQDGPGPQESGYLSSLTPENSRPIEATVVDARNQNSSQNGSTSDFSFGELIRDRRLTVFILLMLLIMIGLAVSLALVSTSSSSSNKNDTGTPSSPATYETPTFAPASFSPTTHTLEDFIVSITVDPSTLRRPSSPHQLAYQALPSNALELYGKERVEQMYSCQVLRYSIIELSGNDVASAATRIGDMRRTLVGDELDERLELYHDNENVLPRKLVEELDECTWPVIQCNTLEQVFSLQLEPYANWKFSLPEELYLLTNLITLDITGHVVVGSLPSFLASLSMLSTIRLEGCGFTGSVPTEFASMPQLETLKLGYNQLHGTIPTEFGGMTALHEISVYSNHLTGTIPTQMFANSELCYVYLNQNVLSGTLPTEIGTYRVLKVFYADENKLTGTLPTEIGYITDLSGLHLNTNSLRGTIPDEWKNMLQMGEFRLHDNKLTGTIPPGLSRFKQLWGDFTLSQNLLTGTIPTGFGGLQGATNLLLGTNKLTGTIPSQLGLLTTIAYGLSFSENNLSGTIPTQLAQLTNIQSLSLDTNPLLSGTVPTEFENLTNLLTFTAYDTNVNGSVPQKVCTLQNLTTVEVDCDVTCTCCTYCF